METILFEICGNMGKLMASSSKQQKVKKKSSVLISFQSNKENGVYFKRAELRKYLDLLSMCKFLVGRINWLQ